VSHLVQIFRELRRVLRKDGTLFLNIMDTHNSEKRTDEEWKLKPKDLYGVPQRLVLALQEDGWWWRSDAIWGKAGGNCPRCYYRIEKGSTKPESAKDRFVKAHEYVYLLTKSKKYFFDHEGVKEKRSTSNRRDVFYIPSQSFRGAHYATMPLPLAEIGVLGGTSDHGSCAKCSAPYRRITVKGAPDREKQKASGSNADGEYHGENTKDYEEHGAEKPGDLKRRILDGMRKIETTGWRQSCKCKDPGEPIPCLVMDPFSGAATTGAAALKHGRRYLGLELLPSNNTEIAAPRLDAVLQARVPDEEIVYLPLDSGVYRGKAENLLLRVPPASVRLILTDPPYNTSRKNNFHTMGRTGIDFEWDGDFDQEEWIILADKALMPGGSIVVWNDWKVLGIVAGVLTDMGYDVKRNFTWVKTNPMPRNTKRSFVQKTEAGLWAVKPGAKWVFNKNPEKSYEDGIFTYGVPRAKKGRDRHQSKKPDAMFKEIIKILSNEDDLILDPFVGGGTTSYAAETTGRRSIAFEESEKWYEEAVAHWMEGAEEGAPVVAAEESV
jgi:DNA modification methylase